MYHVQFSQNVVKYVHMLTTSWSSQGHIKN